MDRRSNMQTLWIQQTIFQIKKLTSFNRCASLSCIMPFLSITLFSLPSVIFPHINTKPQQTLRNRWLSSWTILLLIHNPKSNTEKVGCNYPYIPAPHAFESLKPEAGPVESIFSAKFHLTPIIQKILRQLPTMSYSSCARSCAISWRQQLRPNMAPSFSTPKRLYLSASPSLKWYGNRYPHPFKWKTPLL